MRLDNVIRLVAIIILVGLFLRYSGGATALMDAISRDVGTFVGTLANPGSSAQAIRQGRVGLVA